MKKQNADNEHGTLTGDNHSALWHGRFKEGPDAAAVEFETSIYVDERMALDDIHGSVAHASMLGAQGIIPKKDADLIVKGLNSIEKDYNPITLFEQTGIYGKYLSLNIP